MKRHVVAMTVLASLWIPVVASGGHVDFQKNLRLPSPISYLPATLALPIGCEIAGCYPGFASPGTIDLHIRIDAGVVSNVTLRFEGIDAATLASLTLSGNAQRAGDTIRAGPGESKISGFPMPPEEGVIPVAIIRTSIDDEAWKTLAASDANDSKEIEPVTGGIEITQSSRGFIVNWSRSRFRVTVPTGPPSGADSITLNNAAANDRPVLLADFRSSTKCENDVAQRATASVSIGNALSNGNCRAEVSVFGFERAMKLIENVTWTDDPTDALSVDLTPIAIVPVTVWATTRATMLKADDDFAGVNVLYNRNRTGIQFSPTIVDLSQNRDAVNSVLASDDCGSAPELAQTAFFTPGRLNVYYVDEVFTGVQCDETEPNMIFVGTASNAAVLAHEIGHAFGLAPYFDGGHVNGLPGFGNDNIMTAGGTAVRDSFTLGQAFRMNVDELSQFVLNDNRTPRRNCRPRVATDECPEQSLDSLPH